MTDFERLGMTDEMMQMLSDLEQKAQVAPGTKVVVSLPPDVVLALVGLARSVLLAKGRARQMRRMQRHGVGRARVLRVLCGPVRPRGRRVRRSGALHVRERPVRPNFIPKEVGYG